MPERIEVSKLTPEKIAGLLPPSWVFSFVDIKAALHYYYRDAEIVD